MDYNLYNLHYCWDWDGMLIDKLSPEYECCLCFKKDDMKKSKDINYIGMGTARLIREGKTWREDEQRWLTDEEQAEYDVKRKCELVVESEDEMDIRDVIRDCITIDDLCDRLRVCRQLLELMKQGDSFVKEDWQSLQRVTDRLDEIMINEVEDVLSTVNRLAKDNFKIFYNY